MHPLKKLDILLQGEMNVKERELEAERKNNINIIIIITLGNNNKNDASSETQHKVSTFGTIKLQLTPHHIHHQYPIHKPIISAQVREQKQLRQQHSGRNNK